MSCKYYGKHWAGSSFGLVDTLGNQCGAIRRAHAPCRMEIMGGTPDEKTCPLAIDPANPTEIFDRIGQAARVRLARSAWIEGKIVIASRNGLSIMVQLDQPLVRGRTFAVHPQLGFVAMLFHVDGARWKDTVTGVFCEVEFGAETPLGPPQQDSGPPGNASTHS